MSRIICLLLLGVFIVSSSVFASSSTDKDLLLENDTIVPKAFIIGQFEKQFEKLMEDHQVLLLTACNNDMNLAFEKWQDMLTAMETHSDAVNFDLKGVKLWLNIFWEADGRIKHIAYYLKPNSRNVDTDKLTLFLMSFVNNYQFPLTLDEKFSHYGVASFPTFAREKTKEKDTGSNKIGPLVKDSVNSSQNDNNK